MNHIGFVLILMLCINACAKHPFHSLASNTSLSDLFDNRFVLLLQIPGIYAKSVSAALRKIGHEKEYRVFPTLYNAPTIWNLEDIKHQRLAASVTSSLSSAKQMFVEPAYFHPRLYGLAHTSKEQLIIVLQDPIYSYLPLLRKHGCIPFQEVSSNGLFESMSRVVVGESSSYMSNAYHATHERAMKLIRHMRWLPIIRERHRDSLRVLRSLLGSDIGAICVISLQL